MPTQATLVQMIYIFHTRKHNHEYIYFYDISIINPQDAELGQQHLYNFNFNIGISFYIKIYHANHLHFTSPKKHE